MRYLIISDVFGRSDALEEIASELSDRVDIFATSLAKVVEASEACIARKNRHA